MSKTFVFLGPTPLCDIAKTHVQKRYRQSVWEPFWVTFLPTWPKNDQKGVVKRSDPEQRFRDVKKAPKRFACNTFQDVQNTISKPFEFLSQMYHFWVRRPEKWLPNALPVSVSKERFRHVQKRYRQSVCALFQSPSKNPLNSLLKTMLFGSSWPENDSQTLCL